jgi:AAA domain
MKKHTIIVLTGGPGGGKTALIDEFGRDPAWRGSFLALPEAIFVAGRVGIPMRERLFQKLMVEFQRALEDALARTLDPVDPRFILCHRGTLDPLAYWLYCGWSEDEFFTFTGTKREDHYRRYTAVIHLVTAADGAAEHYTRWPEAHRPETPEESIKLDNLLEKVWHDHPRFYRLDNKGISWEQKSRKAKEIIQQFLLVG